MEIHEEILLYTILCRAGSRENVDKQNGERKNFSGH